MDEKAMAPIWQNLRANRDELAAKSQISLFEADPRRFEALSFTDQDLLIDFSKTKVTGETIRLLLELAQAAGVEARRDAMFRGERINSTEKRSVLHVALRNRSNRPILADG